MSTTNLICITFIVISIIFIIKVLDDVRIELSKAIEMNTKINGLLTKRISFLEKEIEELKKENEKNEKTGV